MTRHAVVYCADQPIQSGGAFVGKQFVQDALEVSNTDKPRLCTTYLECREMVDSFKPFDALLLFGRARI